MIDAYARRILGWRVATTMTTTMVLDAIEQAIWTRAREGIFDLKDVVHHTDQGSQYTSIRFSERLAEAGIQPSVGAAARRARSRPFMSRVSPRSIGRGSGCGRPARTRRAQGCP